VEERKSSHVGGLERDDPGPLRILLAEDDPGVAAMYRLGLELKGHRVFVAGDGPEAIRLARRHLPDLLLLDIEMPHLDGYGVLEQLRQEPETRGLPVVVLSNVQPKTASVRRMRALGMDTWLVKNRTSPRELAQALIQWRKEREGRPGHSGTHLRRAVDGILRKATGPSAGVPPEAG
jgi:two-component system, OmpR family, alkaline phosphatase synthesis response regulator PhoP